MGRKSKAQRRHDRRGYIPANEFREVLVWLDLGIVSVLARAGGEGIEASLVSSRLVAQQPPIGWTKLDPQKRSSQYWASVRRLSESKQIESYHSNLPRHNRSRIRLRIVNVLDRLTQALETE